MKPKAWLQNVLRPQKAQSWCLKYSVTQKTLKKTKNVCLQDPLIKQMRIRKLKDIVPRLSQQDAKIEECFSFRELGVWLLSNAEASPALTKGHRGDTNWEEAFGPLSTTGRIEAKRTAQLQTCLFSWKRKVDSKVKTKTREGKAERHEVLFSGI